VKQKADFLAGLGSNKTTSDKVVEEAYTTTKC
jgi:hypothetical protein